MPIDVTGLALAIYLSIGGLTISVVAIGVAFMWAIHSNRKDRREAAEELKAYQIKRDAYQEKIYGVQWTIADALTNISNGMATDRMRLHDYDWRLQQTLNGHRIHGFGG